MSMSMSVKKWIEKRKEYIEHIKTFDINKDNRVKTTTQIGYMHGALIESVTGWSEWINNMIGTELNRTINVEDNNTLILSDEELTTLHEKYKEFSLKYIELDIAISEIVSKKIPKKKSNKWPKRNIEVDKRMIS